MRINEKNSTSGIYSLQQDETGEGAKGLAPTKNRAPEK
jgi:hypothetical protein